MFSNHDDTNCVDNDIFLKAAEIEKKKIINKHSKEFSKSQLNYLSNIPSIESDSELDDYSKNTTNPRKKRRIEIYDIKKQISVLKKKKRKVSKNSYTGKERKKLLRKEIKKLSEDMVKKKVSISNNFESRMTEPE